MNAAEILERAKSEGVTLGLSDAGGIHYKGDQSAVARWLPVIRENKAELLAVLTRTPEPAQGADCMRCNNLTMRAEFHDGTRRRFFWRCSKGFELLEARNFAERVILAPPECDSFEQWQAGNR
jgi:hypothetical protein